MTLEQDLTTLKPAPPIEGLLRELASCRSIETDTRSNYLSVRPHPVGAIAMFVHARKISIAIDPSLANKAALTVVGAVIKPNTPATTFIVLTADDLAQNVGASLALAVAAVDWRAGGPALTLGEGRARSAAPAPEICPNCWLVISPTGACGC